LCKNKFDPSCAFTIFAVDAIAVDINFLIIASICLDHQFPIIAFICKLIAARAKKKNKNYQKIRHDRSIIPRLNRNRKQK
jgi:hypothetical protein